MAKIVLIAEARAGFCEIDDVIDIHDDDVELTGAGYLSMTVVPVKGITAADLMAKFDLMIPEQKEEGEEGKESTFFWLDGTVWREIKNRPKYPITFHGVTAKDRADLAGGMLSNASRDTILDSSC